MSDPKSEQITYEYAVTRYDDDGTTVLWRTENMTDIAEARKYAEYYDASRFDVRIERRPATQPWTSIRGAGGESDG